MSTQVCIGTTGLYTEAAAVAHVHVAPFRMSFNVGHSLGEIVTVCALPVGRPVFSLEFYQFSVDGSGGWNGEKCSVDSVHSMFVFHVRLELVSPGVGGGT